MNSLPSCINCTQEIKKNDEILKSSCDHLFHKNCLLPMRDSYYLCLECINIFKDYSRISFEESLTNLNEKVPKIKTQCTENFNGIVMRTAETLKTLNNFDKDSEFNKQQIEINEMRKKLEKRNNDVQVLEQKMQQLTMLLDKEIRNNIELSADKMRLTSTIECMKTEDLKENNPIEKVITNNKLMKSDTKLRSIIIRGIENKKHTKESLKKMVIELCKILEIDLLEVDIEEIYMLTKSGTGIAQYNGQNITTKSFLVQFKNIDLKLKILENIDKLKLHPLTARYDITEYLNVETNILYEYAKELKVTDSYYRIYCKDNKVYAQKGKESASILISNKKQLNEMLGDKKESLDSLSKLL